MKLEKNTKNEFDASYEKRKGRRKNRKFAMNSLFLVVITWAVITTLLCVYFVLFNGSTIDTGKNAPEADLYYTEDELQTAIVEAKETEKQTFLSELKNLMQTGDGTIPMLRHFFPEQIIFANEGKYLFFQISEALKKNPYNVLEIRTDEETGRQSVYDGDLCVSKMGIDVSRYNGVIDWEEVSKDTVDYAFIRVGIRGYGTGEIVPDEQYINNIKGANRVGIPVGVYFFSQAINEEEAVEEADFVIENIKEHTVDFPVAIDVEALTNAEARTANLSQEQRTDICIAFLEKIKAAGYKPMIYGNIKSFFLLLDLTRLEQYDKWYAYYDNSIYYPYDFSIWQYSAMGTVQGIDEPVDLNLLMGDFY